MTSGRSEFWQRLKSTILIPNGTAIGVFDAPGVIGLTFDDGPDRENTPRILDILRRHGARATFFILTDHGLTHRDLLKRMLDEGHQVGLHFDRHDRITELPPLTAWTRMMKARRLLAELVGPVSLVRPPYGSQNYVTYVFARLLGLKVIGWNRLANDWLEQSPQSAAKQAYENLSGGDIILMHDGLEVEAGLPTPTFDRCVMVDLFLSEATARGLRSVTIGSLLAQGHPRRSHWFRR